MLRYVYFIRLETTHGPYFRSKAGAMKYLKDDDPEWWDRHGASILAGTDPYCGIVRVKLGDLNAVFDG